MYTLNNLTKLNTSAPAIIQTLSPKQLNELYKIYLNRIILHSRNERLKASYSNRISKHNNNSQNFKKVKLIAYACHFSDRTTKFRCKRAFGKTEFQTNHTHPSIQTSRARNTNFSRQVNIKKLEENIRKAQTERSAQSSYQMKNQEPIINHKLEQILSKIFNGERERLNPNEHINLLVAQMQNGNESID